MEINFIFDSIRQTRSLFTELVGEFSLEALNTIPPGFANNIVWNYGHLAVTSPALCYQRTGVRPDLEIPFQSAYGKGTKPEYFIDADELAALTNLLKSSIVEIQKDYTNGVFAEIRPFSTTTYQAQLSTIEDVLLTTLIHDNLHLGYAMAQRKLLK